MVTNDLVHDQRMIRICTALQEAGHAVTLVGREKPNSPPLTNRPFQQTRLKCWFHTGPLFYLEFNIRLYAYLLGQPPEILNTIDADTLLAGGLYQTVKPVRWIHDAHELFTEVPELSGKQIKKSLWLRLEKWAFSRFDAVYTVSESVAKWYQPMSPNTIAVIRNVPVRSTANLPEISSKTGHPILIYQGALNEGRCIENYIRVIKSLDAVLWIVGEGDLSESLREYARNQGVMDKVVFHGWKSPEELKSLTRLASVGLNVLEDDGLSYRYSLANKCFDYIHAGLPSIHSPFPEYQHLNEQYQVFELAEPKDESILNAIKLLLFDREKYHRLRDNCNIASGYLDWTTEKGKLVAIYETTR